MDIEQVVRENIEKTIHLSLGTSRDNKPWVCEVHFAYDDNLNLYFRSLKSRRHSQEIANNPNVAGNIIKQHAVGEYPLGLYFEGTAEMLQPGDAQNKASERLKKRLQIPGDILEEAKDENGHQFYKITVTNFYVFGKLDNSGGKKYELAWGEAK